MDKTIDCFKGNFDFLSNFSRHPVIFQHQIYPTSEHLYQALKTFDLFDRETIRIAETPGIAKKLGRQVKIRSNWNSIKNDYMYRILKLKFNNNENIKKKLISTVGYELIEGNNWHDNYWGNCYCKKCENIKGQNHLGKALMKLRYSYFINQIVDDVPNWKFGDLKNVKFNV